MIFNNTLTKWLTQPFKWFSFFHRSCELQKQQIQKILTATYSETSTGCSMLNHFIEDSSGSCFILGEKLPDSSNKPPDQGVDFIPRAWSNWAICAQCSAGPHPNHGYESLAVCCVVAHSSDILQLPISGTGKVRLMADTVGSPHCLGGAGLGSVGRPCPLLYYCSLYIFYQQL